MTEAAANNRRPTPARVFARLVSTATVAAGLLALAALALAAYVPALGSSSTLLAAVALAWCGSIAAAYCAARVVGRPPTIVATGLLIGIGARLIVTLGLALALWSFLTAAQGDLLLIAVGVAQTVLLATDSAAALRAAREIASIEIETESAPGVAQGALQSAELR